MEGRIPISLAIFFLSFFTFVSAFEERGSTHGKDGETDVDLDKRPYDAGKKPYHYLNEYKRLPLYNFGLGKRSPRYNFGLGKRYLEEEELTNEYEDYPFAEEEEFPEPEMYLDDEMQAPEKRQQRPYSFGLGKRLPKYDFGLGKRAGPYDFGLGKRTQRYSFGLGKRNGLYSFGLGKKNSDPGTLGNRYSFGLGKRSVDLEMQGDRRKRDVSEKDTEDANSGKEVGHHELEKRSKNSSNGFSRRYRKPSFSYNFGLGKRRPMYDFGLGKRNYQEDNSY